MKVKQAALKGKDAKRYRALLESQSWENWQDEEKGGYYNLHSVLFSKLEWIKEQLQSGGPANEDERDESLETIRDVQEYLDILHIQDTESSAKWR